MWRRLMNLLLCRNCVASETALDALFAASLSAQERAAQASDDVGRASDRNRQHLETVRTEIARRTAAGRRTRPEPHTSDVRAMVEEVVNRPGLRGLPPNKDSL